MIELLLISQLIAQGTNLPIFSENQKYQIQKLTDSEKNNSQKTPYNTTKPEIE